MYCIADFFKVGYAHYNNARHPKKGRKHPFFGFGDNVAFVTRINRFAVNSADIN